MNNIWRADLHSHSHCSDGTFTVEELITHAKSLGLQGLSITDHDTIEAYQNGPEIAARLGLSLLSGVEFSTTFDNISIHVLCYAFKLNSPELLALCQRHISRRTERNKAILEKLAFYKINISEDELKEAAGAFPRTSIGRPHIAQVMLKKKKVDSIKEAFHLYLGDHAPCFVKGEPITTEETLEIIKKADGMAFLAHPHLVDRGEIVEQVLELPFDGIEGYYGTFGHDQNERWIKMAQRRRLMLVGGSDFHGKIKPNIPLGCSWTPEETFNILWNRYTKNNPNIPIP